MDNLFGAMSTAVLRRGYGIRFRATGQSMQPTIEDGDMITVAPVAPADIRRGDILLYQSERSVKAHRVVGINQPERRPEYVLRGDASDTCDDPVEATQVLGRVVSVQRRGRRIDLVSRRAKWLHAARASASPVLRWLRPTALLLALLTGGHLAVPEAQAAFGFRKPITIDHTKVGTAGGPATLSNLPILYSVTDANLATVSNGGNVQNANGWDIIFRATDSTTCGGPSVCTLDFEVEQYVATSGKLIAWVKLPSVNAIGSGSDTVIYIYYGDSGISAQTADTTPCAAAQCVWDTNYKGVWHLQQTTGGHNLILDSTSNANHMTTQGVPAPTLGVAGQIGNSITFDGANNFLIRDGSIGDTLNGLGITADITLEAWIKVGTTAKYAGLVAKQDPTNGWDYDMDYSDNVCSASTIDLFADSFGANVACSTGTITTTTSFHHVAVTRTGCCVAGTVVTTYIDGAAAGSTNTAFVQNAFGNVTTGVTIAKDGAPPNADYFKGTMDEVRISNVGRDKHWIAATYNNTCGCVTFLTTGAQQNSPPSLAHMKMARALSHDGVQNRVVQLEWRTSYEVDHLGFHVYREQKGERLRVTPALIAGSALKAGAGTVLTAGHSYSWWDVVPAGGGPLRYWLEEVDLKGHHTWHGPVEVESAKGQRLAAEPERVRSVLLTRMGRGQVSVTAVPWYGTREASMAKPTQEQLAVQWRLAAGQALKLGVQAEGWYHVSMSELVAAGLDSRVNPRHLQLFADGKEVPILVTGEQDGRVDPTSAIEFYGLGLDTPWTDTRTYWLVDGHQAGKRVGWVPSREMGVLGPLSYPSTLEWRPRTIYLAALLNGEADNYFGPVVSTDPVDQVFTLTHLDPSPQGEAGLEVTLQGVVDGLHQVEVRLNGLPVGMVTFEGMAQGTTQVRLPQNRLQEGANVVALVAQGGETDISLVASVRLTAWRFYQADSDLLEAPVRGGDQVTITGFSSPQVRVLDVTQPDAVQAVRARVKREKTGFAVTVVAPGSGSRALLVFTEARRAMPASVQLNHPSQWHASGHRADLVIMTHANFVPSLASLQAWRQQQGWTVALIDVQEVYDEFNFGAKSPWALRALMQQARSHWARPPRFLLLAGDASVDPRNFMGMGVMDYVPTKLVDTKYLETSSDDWFGDLDDDGVPKIAVGRLAVQTSAQADVVVRKLIDYDRAGTVARAAVLVADHDDAIDFEGFSDQVKALLPADVKVEQIYRGQMGDDAARAAVLSSLNSGPWLVNYFGHGSVEVWLGNLLSSDDARVLTNGVRLPFVVAMTCLNGFFHDVFSVSLAETLQTASQGGAVAVWASSGLTDAQAQAPMNHALMQQLEKGLTLGEMTAQAKAAASDPDVRHTWILFGDPTTRLH
jgi:signal peptidase I